MAKWKIRIQLDTVAWLYDKLKTHALINQIFLSISMYKMILVLFITKSANNFTIYDQLNFCL